jgi:plasmid stabilization system protein ParE
MKLRYTPQARRHLDAIAHYIAERNPDAAVRVGYRLREVIDLLVAIPTFISRGSQHLLP